MKPLPVLASGGIGDGKAVAKAIRLGAQGVSLGTRFVASEEAWVHQAYKERLLGSTADDTVFAKDLFDVGWPNAPHRVIRNKVVEEWEAAGRPHRASDRERAPRSACIGIRGGTRIPGDAMRSAC